jgi:hypothetical protein
VARALLSPADEAGEGYASCASCACRGHWPPFAVGALLALAGTMMQVLLRNPLADPYVLGLSGGAACGALVALLAGHVRARDSGALRVLWSPPPSCSAWRAAMAHGRRRNCC